MDRTHGGRERERRDAGQDQRPGDGEREHAADHEQARPSPRAPSRRPAHDKNQDDHG